MPSEPDARDSGDAAAGDGHHPRREPIVIQPPPWLAAGASPRRAGAPDDARAQARAAAAQGVLHYNSGEYAEALNYFLTAVRIDATEAEYHHMLGCTAQRAGRPQLVEPHLLQAVCLRPDHVGAHTALGSWYAERGPAEKALHHTAAALNSAPDDPKVILARASALFTAGDKHATFHALRPLLDEPVPQRWAAQLYARVAPAIAQEEQALAVIDRALQDPDLGPTPDGAPLLHFAAAALLEQINRFDEAFDRARQANQIARTSRAPFDPSAHSARISNAIRYFTRQRMRALPRATHSNRRPVFIVGMPRSGTSLVEQILSSHPDVFGAGELSTLSVIAGNVPRMNWAAGEPYPQCLDLLSPRHADDMAAAYLSVIEPMNAEARYVTDKMPTNFLNLELAELLFPDCRVIHCVRNPLDTCLSCYMSNFANGNEFSFDLSHLGPYYRDYQRLMDHWNRALSIPILDVRYEDLVLDTGQQIQRMLNFLDLPWDDRCLKFYENRRSVLTSSRDQVNRPIYTSSVARWKFYEKHLGELIAALSAPAQSRRRAG